MVGLTHDGPIALALAASEDVIDASAALWGDELAHRASSRTPAGFSARAAST